MKKHAAFLLLLALLLTGCGTVADSAAASGPGTSAQSVSDTASALPPCYSVDYQKAGAAWENVKTCLWDGKRFLCAARESSESWYAARLFWAGPYDDEAQELELGLTGNEAISCFCLGGDGELYVILSNIQEDAVEGAEGVLMDGYAASRLLCMDKDGTLQFETSLPQTGTSAYSAIAATADGTILAIVGEFDAETGFFSEDSLVHLDSAGLVETRSAASVLGTAGNLTDFYTAADGSLLLAAQIEEWPALYPLDAEAMTVGEPCYTAAAGDSWPTFYAGDGADFYVADDENGITAYQLDGTSRHCFSLEELSAPVPERAVPAAFLGDNQYLFMTELLGVTYFITITGQWEPAETQAVTTLTIGTVSEYYNLMDLSEITAAFQVLHPEYSVTIKNYDSDGLTAAEDIRKELNQDILDGEGPDLLILDGSVFTCATYAGNGFLQDLYPLMDGDADFHREDYLENVFSAYEQNGKLYGFISTFTIYTAFTNREYLEAPEGWTPAECQALAEGSEIPLLSGLTAGMEPQDRSIAKYLLGSGLQDYISGDTCDFTSGEFAAMLELLAADYPETPEAETVEESLYLQNGTYLLADSWILGASYLSQILWEMGETSVMTGYPTPSRSRISIEPDDAIGISAQTADTAGCWEFIKLLESSTLAGNDLLRIGEFHTNRAALEETLHNATLGADEAGTYLTGPISYTIGNDTAEIEPEPLTEAQAAELLSLIEHTRCSLVDAETREIVAEETAAFFAGDKTAEETAEIIQNRVRIHLSEAG